MKDFVAIDFETANCQHSSICSVGIVIVKDGEIVEQGTTEQLFHHGSHPYTRELVGETLKIMGEDNNA